MLGTTYGLDTVGFHYRVVGLIQQQGPAHGVEFPCNVYIYQSMNYDGIDLYVTNLLQQAIGSEHRKSVPRWSMQRYDSFLNGGG
jgi:hypothetical protein